MKEGYSLKHDSCLRQPSGTLAAAPFASVAARIQQKCIHVFELEGKRVSQTIRSARPTANSHLISSGMGPNFGGSALPSSTTILWTAVDSHSPKYRTISKNLGKAKICEDASEREQAPGSTSQGQHKRHRNNIVQKNTSTPLLCALESRTIHAVHVSGNVIRT